MRKSVLVAFVTVGMACGVGSAKAQSPQAGSTQVTVTDSSPSASGGSLGGDPSPSSDGSSSFERFNIFGGYSYLGVHLGDNTYNYNGGSGSVDVNLNRFLGIVLDVGGYHRGFTGGSSNVVTAVIGPKLYLGWGRFTPFGQALLGATHETDKTCTAASHGGFMCGEDTSGAATVVVGGGVDVKISKYWAIRAVEIDDVITKFNSVTQNNGRISVGAVLRF